MANIVTWALLGITVGGLIRRILRHGPLLPNLAGGAITCIAAGLILVPLVGLDFTAYTMALFGMIAGLAFLSIFTPPKKAGD